MQKPLAYTQSMEHLCFRELPTGQTAIVAIACHSGYDQEDSIIVNQSSIDHSFMRSYFYRGLNEAFAKPSRQTTVGLRYES